MTDWKPWLRKLAAQGGKGVVDNIDARCLGRIADDLERMENALTSYERDRLFEAGKGAIGSL